MTGPVGGTARSKEEGPLADGQVGAGRVSRGSGAGDRGNAGFRRTVLEAVAVGCGARSEAVPVRPERGSGACRLTTLRGLTGVGLADLEDAVIALEGEGLLEIENLRAPRPRLRVRITAAGEAYLGEGGVPARGSDGEGN